MPSPLDPNEELREQAYQRLDETLAVLKEARKVLRRDWEQLSPGERSARSREVKNLEDTVAQLEEEIEMNRPLTR